MSEPDAQDEEQYKERGDDLERLLQRHAEGRLHRTQRQTDLRDYFALRRLLDNKENVPPQQVWHDIYALAQ